MRIMTSIVAGAAVLMARLKRDEIIALRLGEHDGHVVPWCIRVEPDAATGLLGEHPQFFIAAVEAAHLEAVRVEPIDRDVSVLQLAQHARRFTQLDAWDVAVGRRVLIEVERRNGKSACTDEHEYLAARRH